MLTCASLLAGFVDSIVGGGGLILVPALFAVFPHAPPATLLGTNKSASVWGTATATWRYARRVQVRWSALLPAALVCLVCAWLGAWAVTLISAEQLRRALPFIRGLCCSTPWPKRTWACTTGPAMTGPAMPVGPRRWPLVP